MNIDEAKQQLKDNFIEGMRCPCCDQLVKKYSRKLTRSMAIGLMSLYRQQHTPRPIHIKKIEGVNGGEFAQLRRWGLIRAATNTTTTKRMSGLWFITYKGAEFVKGRMQVPAYCDTYNGETLSFSEEMTTIKQALGRNFDYAEMMGVPFEAARREVKAVSWINDEGY
jgi:hypothetical protein